MAEKRMNEMEENAQIKLAQCIMYAESIDPGNRPEVERLIGRAQAYLDIAENHKKAASSVGRQSKSKNDEAHKMEQLLGTLGFASLQKGHTTLAECTKKIMHLTSHLSKAPALTAGQG